MNTDLQELFVFNLTLRDALANMLVALLCGIMIAIFYRITYRGISYSSSYVISLIMLALITSLVIMVIGNNLARAFGLVGAMSIIRFRTAVKDTQDIMFIFFSLAVGLACGAGMYPIALVGTLFIGTVIYLATNINTINPVKKDFLMQVITTHNLANEQEYDRLFRKYCTKHKLVNVKSIGEEDDGLIEFSYYLNLKRQNKAREFTAALKQVPGVKKINAFFDEG